MNPQDHYGRAEDLLGTADESLSELLHDEALSSEAVLARISVIRTMMQAAQVHATLATCEPPSS
jgi:hypothetical protein